MKTNLLIILLALGMQNAVAALYTVPVSEELSQYAIFELDGFKSKSHHNEVEIKYKIPKVLTGVQQEVVFTGQVDDKAYSNTLSGPNGKMVCTKGATEAIKCEVTYVDLLTDEDKAVETIKELSKDNAEVFGRIEVMKAFSSDPVGIIHY